MYESIRPFLESLKSTDPHRLPMAKYLVAGDQANNVAIPEYSVKPGFKWDLGSLLASNSGGGLTMSPTNEVSVTKAREELKKHGKLDPR